MLEKTARRLAMKALVVSDSLHSDSSFGQSARALVEELRDQEVEVFEADSAEVGTAIFVSDASIHAILLEWSSARDYPKAHQETTQLLHLVRLQNMRIPIFLLADREEASSVPVEILRLADEFIQAQENTTDFIAGRIIAAIRRYEEVLLPPMAAALLKFAAECEYSWHTPGHGGGTAFLKSPAGRMFYDYLGENVFRSDLSVSVEELGSLLDHTGPIGEGEKRAASIFGAHRSYSVTNGTSSSNRIVITAAVARGQIALCDRNCHKSIEHGITLAGAIPTYLMPSRNRYGIIGPIPPDLLAPEAIRTAIRANPLVAPDADRKPAYCVITNSTYDGLCYDVSRVQEILDPTVDRLHFDEAWYGYARFNPLYQDRFAMRGHPESYRGATLFATHSTHKVLAALSQGSFLHVRDGRNPIEHSRLNEAFMMHSSTSPLYSLIASNDIAAAMMEGVAGAALTTESIQEAVSFRQEIGRIAKEFATQGTWFVRTWNAEQVVDPKTRQRMSFEEAPAELLVSDPRCWVLQPGESWHGFDDIEDGYCMLDPIKVSVLTPGVSVDGSLEKTGIPARLLGAYLDRHGIVVEKTTDFTILFLFTIGITRGKWGTLVNALLDFKRDVDANTALEEALPAIFRDDPKRYAGMGLRDLADQMFAQMRDSRQMEWQEAAFSSLPRAVITPSQAYQQLVRNRIEKLPLSKMAGRAVATGVVPYPPCIPMLMPGEDAGADEGPFLRYLQALQEWDAHFPGFCHDTHGIESVNGTYHVCCVKRDLQSES
jgi:arginine decarboxylase